MNVENKLRILADAAKYDASCASSGSTRKRPEGGSATRRAWHLSQLHAGRPMRLAAEDSADELLHLRLPLLRQPRVERYCRARDSRSRRW